LNGKTFKVHLDGDDLLPFFKGDEKQSPREGFLYWSDDGDLFAIRVGNWKATFIEQEHTGLDVWQKGFTTLRMPLLFNLRADPFERGSEGMDYDNWLAHRMFLFVPAQALVAKWLESFKEFPPRHKAASFTVSDVMEKMTTASSPNRN
jgi:arylsulfatase